MRRLRRQPPLRLKVRPRPPIPRDRPQLVRRQRPQRRRLPCPCSRGRVPTAPARDQHRLVRRRANRGRHPTARAVAPVQVRCKDVQALAARLALLPRRRVPARRRAVVLSAPSPRRLLPAGPHDQRQGRSQHAHRHQHRRGLRQPRSRRQRALPQQRQRVHPCRVRPLLQRRLLSQPPPRTQKHSLQ
jgi:hypothetical protein